MKETFRASWLWRLWSWWLSCWVLLLLYKHLMAGIRAQWQLEELKEINKTLQQVQWQLDRNDWYLRQQGRKK